jgi:predicted nuclease of predicted toxin-antitoxin system
MRCFIDQDVYRETVDVLVQRGHDVVRAKEVGLSEASDETLLAYAGREQRVLVTRDKGFGHLAFLLQPDHHGVILLRVSPSTMTSGYQE